MQNGALHDPCPSPPPLSTILKPLNLPLQACGMMAAVAKIHLTPPCPPKPPSNQLLPPLAPTGMQDDGGWAFKPGRSPHNPPLPTNHSAAIACPAHRQMNYHKAPLLDRSAASLGMQDDGCCAVKPG